jgi:hypothetical protein
MTNFEVFQKEFRKWQKNFGLNGYNIHFKHEPLYKCYADILVNQKDMVALVRLNSEAYNGLKPHRNIKKSAKHEAIHLLIARLEETGRYRFSSDDEISQASEDLVNRLEDLIK